MENPAYKGFLNDSRQNDSFASAIPSLTDQHMAWWRCILFLLLFIIIKQEEEEDQEFLESCQKGLSIT